MQSANERQVGGSHYRDAPVEQHWDRMWKTYREAWFVGNITKYVERYRAKDGLKDLEKARHYLDKLIELEKSDECKRVSATGQQDGVRPNPQPSSGGKPIYGSDGDAPG